MGGRVSREPTKNVTYRYGYTSQYYEPDWRTVVPGTGVPGAYKVVSVGINYLGSEEFQLAGSITDSHNHLRFLKRRGWVPAGGCRVLTEDRKGDFPPTRENIVNALQWLTEGAQPGHTMYFHFSGHGVELPDDNGDAPSGFDRCILPVDYKRAGAIRDDQITQILSRAPAGSRVIVVCDCAYACSFVDLPWQVILGESSFRWLQARQARDLRGAHIIMFSAEKDAQTTQNMASAGALSHAFMEALDSNPTQDFAQLLRNLREGLRQRLGNNCKMPAIASSHKFDLQENMSLGCTDKDRQLGAVKALTPGGPPRDGNFFVGMSVEAWFYNDWFPAVVRRINVDRTFDLDWKDGTTTLNADASTLRRPTQPDGDWSFFFGHREENLAPPVIHRAPPTRPLTTPPVDPSARTVHPLRIISEAAASLSSSPRPSSTRRRPAEPPGTPPW